MANYTKHASERYSAITLGKLVLTIKANVSDTDEITVAEFDNTVDFNFAKAVVLETGVECGLVALTGRNNVLKIDEVISSKEVIILIAGDVA